MLFASRGGEAKTAENGAFYTTVAASHTTGMNPILSSLRAFDRFDGLPAALLTRGPAQSRPFHDQVPSSPWRKSDRAVRSGFGTDARSSEAPNTRGIQASGDAAAGPEPARTATRRLSPRAASHLMTAACQPPANCAPRRRSPPGGPVPATVRSAGACG